MKRIACQFAHPTALAVAVAAPRLYGSRKCKSFARGLARARHGDRR